MLILTPVTLKRAKEFIAEHHRHHKPPVGHKFSVGVANENGELVGVACAGRPVSRVIDDGLTVEVNRTCTNGARNANSMLYGAIWRAAKALGYAQAITYTQDGESGASLRAAGWVVDKRLVARGSWAESSEARPRTSDTGGVARIRWCILAPGAQARMAVARWPFLR